MSDESATRQGRCVYCGTSRAVTKPVCPECGRTWIDTKIDEELPALTPELVAAAVEERQTAAAIDLPPPPDEKQRRPWGLLIGAVLGLLIIIALFSGVFGGDDDEPQATATTAEPTTTATSTTAAATTTEPTTTAPATTTTSTTTTTTTTTTTLAPIEPEGTAVPVADLTLGAFALGPFGFDAGTPYLGRLVASLGQPDSRTELDGELGLCEGETGFAYTWGWLTGVFRNDDGSEVLVGYRLDQSADDHPTAAITSRSGLAVGDTLARLEAIYLQSGLGFVDIDDTPHFVLLRSTDSATLLWGPVTATDATGVIEGIYSPRSCDSGPVAAP